MTDLDIESFEQDLIGVDPDTLKTAGAGAGELISKAFGIAADKEAAKLATAKSKASAADIQAAQDARTEATKAALRAQGEKDPAGPLHMAAIDAEAKARQLESKVGMMPPGALAPLPPQSGQNPFTKKVGGLPVYGWLLVGVGSAGALALIISMLRKKK